MIIYNRFISSPTIWIRVNIFFYFKGFIFFFKLYLNEEDCIIIQYLTKQFSPLMYAHMFMSICKNFVQADELLREELMTLIDVTKQAGLMGHSGAPLFFSPYESLAELG